MTKAELRKKKLRWDSPPPAPETVPSPTNDSDDDLIDDDSNDFDDGNGFDDLDNLDDYDMDVDDVDDNGDKDYILLEFAQSGDLKNMIAKLHQGGGGIRVPQRVIWSWWLCCECPS